VILTIHLGFMVLNMFIIAVGGPGLAHNYIHETSFRTYESRDFAEYVF
jgi:hypothetical protein